jgi:hypothetical protein
MLGGVAARTLRHMAAEGKIMRMVLPGPKQTRVYFKPDIERILAGRAPAPVARHKRDDQQVLTLLSQLLTQMRPADSPRPALHLALNKHCDAVWKDVKAGVSPTRADLVLSPASPAGAA